MGEFKLIGQVEGAYPSKGLGMLTQLLDQAHGKGKWKLRGDCKEPKIKTVPAKQYQDPGGLIFTMPKQTLVKYNDTGVQLFVEDNTFTSDLYVATNDPHQFHQVQWVMGDHIDQLPVDVPFLNDNNFRKSVIRHAAMAYKVMFRPVIYEETRLHIPGLLEYQSMPIEEAIKRRGVEGIIKDAQTCKEVTMLRMINAINEYGGMEKMRYSANTGTIIAEPRGDCSQVHVTSPLFAHFIIKGYDKTLAEFTPAEVQQLGFYRHWVEFITDYDQKMKFKKSLNFSKQALEGLFGGD